MKLGPLKGKPQKISEKKIKLQSRNSRAMFDSFIEGSNSLFSRGPGRHETSIIEFQNSMDFRDSSLQES